MPCHEKVLAAAKNIIFVKHLNEFTVQEVQVLMAQENAEFSPTTIDTHIRSRCCANAPDNHAVTYPYFERVSRGLYKIRDPYR